MDGAIVDVLVKEGDNISRGQVLVALEAMKMEHSLKADCDGVVGPITLKPGDQVKRQQLLVTISNPESSQENQ